MSVENKYRTAQIHTYYITTIVIILVLFTGLRNIAVGNDTCAYYLSYEEIRKSSWNTLWNDCIMHYRYGVGKDVGYPLFVKATQLFLPNYRFYLFLLAILFYTSVGNLINKFTRDVFESFIAFLMLITLFSVYPLSALRQSIALSVSIFTLKFIANKKLIPFLIVILITSTIHQSILLFLPYYWMAKIRATKLLSLATLFLITIVSLFLRPIIMYFAVQSKSEAFISYVESDTGGGAVTYMTMLALCFILYMLVRKRMNIYYPNNNVYSNSIFLTLVLTPVAWIDPALLRMSAYYAIFLPIIFANCLKCVNTDYRNIMAIVYVSTLSLYICCSPREYNFFWNDMALGENYPFTMKTSGI